MSKLKNVSKICFLLLGALLVHLCCWSQPALAGGKKGDTIVLGGGKGGGGHGGGYGHGGGGGGCGPIILKTGKYLFYFNFFLSFNLFLFRQKGQRQHHHHERLQEEDVPQANL